MEVTVKILPYMQGEAAEPRANKPVLTLHRSRGWGQEIEVTLGDTKSSVSFDELKEAINRLGK